MIKMILSLHRFHERDTRAFIKPTSLLHLKFG